MSAAMHDFSETDFYVQDAFDPIAGVAIRTCKQRLYCK
jgi:hypothetical protein